MLNDREYMRNRFEQREADGMKFLFGLIALNIIVYLLLGNGMTATGPGPQLYYDLALSVPGLHSGRFWQVVTYMFLHGGFTHILFNMYGLYLFGGIAIRRLGPERFALLYFVSGILGGLLMCGVNVLSPSTIGIPLVGASAGVFGVIIAAAMFEPDVQFMLIFPPIPLKLKTLATVYIAFEVFSEFTKSGGNIAHMAHLGGAIAAYLYLRFIYSGSINWDPIGAILGKKTISRKKSSIPKGWSVGSSNSYKNAGKASPKDLDRILDKLSKEGVNSLTSDEMNALRDAREKMKGKS
jgi:membrane associated rhomboid family serine protease